MCIGLGSNVGDREGHLRRAVALLAREVALLKASAVYETAPMYVEDQPAFLNAALLADTAMGPLALLRLLKQVESDVGRAPRERYGPREIDLDLLAFGVAAYRFEDRGKTVLEVPHPRAPERLFVLQPLSDLDPDLVLPGLGSVNALLLATKTAPESVRRLEHVVLSL